MNKVAYIFPGQGVQWVGMGEDVYERSPAARKVFDLADSVLGFSLTNLCFNGPEKELTRTVNAQPALVTAGMAILAAAEEQLGNMLPAADFVAGHSLGEYTALAAEAGLDLADCISLSRERGRLMEEAGKETGGSMAAVIAMTEEQVREVCRETGTWIANYNAPGQIVISGRKEDVKAACILTRSGGAKMAIPLNVSGAFHSPLMKSAAEGLEEAIRMINIRDPRIPVIGNTEAQLIQSAEDVRTELVRQVCSSVQWIRITENLIRLGVDTFIEIGPGEVLGGLIRRISPEVKVININEDLLEDEIYEVFS